MTEAQYRKSVLDTFQALDLKSKIGLTKNRIREWYNANGGQVYVSFSGGKDSTVLLHIVRSIYPDVPAVFIDTGLEYPEVREFVKTVDNVEWLHPIKWDKYAQEYKRTSFKNVLVEYGYPVISKEQSKCIYEYRTSKSEKVRDTRWNGNKWGLGKISEKYKYLVDAPFKISNKCCDAMKKVPARHYEKTTGRLPIIGTMAYESQARTSNWLTYGCNVFEGKRPMSRPMSFWLENDVLEYIVQNNLPYATIYGDIKQREDGSYYTTGRSRTGCIFCCFGLGMEGTPNRFQQLKQSHPQLWEYCMRPTDGGGLGFQEVLDYIGIESGKNDP